MPNFPDPPRLGLRYAAHMGFRSADNPLFLEHVGGLDPYAHIEFSKRLGFAGMMHPWALSYPTAEIAAFAKAAREFEIEGSCVVFAPLDLIKKPLWGEDTLKARETIMNHLAPACRMAQLIRSKTVAAIATADMNKDFPDQHRAMLDNLKLAGDFAAEHGITLVVETMRSLPDMLLRSTSELIEMITNVGHPAVKIAFDTHHCATLDGCDAVLPLFTQCFDQVGVLQIADYPQKTEPGSGEIDFVPILAEAMRRNFKPLVELEFVWSEAGLPGEIAGLERFLAVDAAAQKAANATMAEGAVAPAARH